MKTYETSIYDDEGDETPVVVHYEYERPTRGARDKYGVQLEPDEPANVIIHSVISQLDNTDVYEILVRGQDIEDSIISSIFESMEDDRD